MKSWMPTHQLESSPASKGADAIDTLLADLESSKQEAAALLATIAECRDKAHVEGYGKSFLYEAIACPDDVPAFIGQTVTELRAALEAAAAFVQDVSKQKPERPDYWSSCSQCEHNIDRAQDLLEKQAALSQRQEES
ncbi:hypothetical protein WK22_09530 [Burkholderia multivorans]|nr:hypothetical protein WK22_09530 [Burkholderia multivorans]